MYGACWFRKISPLHPCAHLVPNPMAKAAGGSVQRVDFLVAYFFRILCSNFCALIPPHNTNFCLLQALISATIMNYERDTKYKVTVNSLDFVS